MAPHSSIPSRLAPDSMAVFHPFVLRTMALLMPRSVMARCTAARSCLSTTTSEDLHSIIIRNVVTSSDFSARTSMSYPAPDRPLSDRLVAHR